MSIEHGFSRRDVLSMSVAAGGIAMGGSIRGASAQVSKRIEQLAPAREAGSVRTVGRSIAGDHRRRSRSRADQGEQAMNMTVELFAKPQSSVRWRCLYHCKRRAA
jgi:hypothetical protein